MSKNINEYADYLVSSFDEGAWAQNHSLQRLDFIVVQMLKLKKEVRKTLN